MLAWRVRITPSSLKMLLRGPRGAATLGSRRDRMGGVRANELIYLTEFHDVRSHGHVGRRAVVIIHSRKYHTATFPRIIGEGEVGDVHHVHQGEGGERGDALMPVFVVPLEVNMEH